MTTQVQIIDRGGLVKLFGATIRVAASHPTPSPAAAAGGLTSLPAYRTEYHETIQDFHNDKKAKTTNDDSPWSEKNESPPEIYKEHSTGPASGRDSEASEEDEEMDHLTCQETTDENTENKVDKHEDDKASLAKKKPDKLLPCPRCDSMDTKFCYFNNYNVNQPRHFCRQCQRYWTAGGAVRPNMPVGAGRRKKSSRAAGFGGPRCQQQDGSVVVVMDPAADQAAASARGDTDSAFLSFGGGGGMVSPSSNCLATSNQRQASAVQALPMENFHVPTPQMPWAVNSIGSNPPIYFYGGNPTMPSANGFTPSPQPVHLCWTPTPAAPGGWQLFSVVPWGPQMPSYHPTATPPPMVPAPTAVVGKQSHSHHSHSSYDVDGHSFGSSAGDDRQSSSSLDTSPRPKPAGAKKRSSAIREEEEVRACRSYQLVSDMSGHRTEEVSKVLQSNPAAMMRSLNFQEGV